MQRTFETKGSLQLVIDQIETQSSLEFDAEDVVLEIRYDITPAALQGNVVEAMDIQAHHAVLRHDAVFECGEKDLVQIVARKGADLSVFIPTHLWRDWQQEIASELSNHAPSER